MTVPRRGGALTRSTVLAAGGAVLVLAAGSTVTVAAVAGGLGRHDGAFTNGLRAGCAAPALPGHPVSIQLWDMRSMMRRGGMMTGTGMMRIAAKPTSVPAGAVSLVVTNAGSVTHELVVLPLAAAQPAGVRAIGSDGRIDETGSRGEASATCAAGSGDGIAAGARGWVTLRLPAGRYELVCNLPGHYAAGTYAELDVA